MVKTKSKTPFKKMTRGDQCIYLLTKHGPLTIWELVDKFKNQHESVKWENLRRLLRSLREKDKAGVVNYKEEERRQKLRKEWGGGYYDIHQGRWTYGKVNENYGRRTGEMDYVEVWAAVIEQGAS